ncbi:MAG: BamA/TamA family outer membrane protein [Waddliaceae bacterium]
MRFFFLILFIFANACAAQDADYSYDVNFSGIARENVLKRLYHASQLHAQRQHPPRTESALRRRAERDIENLMDVMQHYAYYNAKVAVDIDLGSSPIHITFMIDPGPAFPLAGVEICPNSYSLTPEQIGLFLGCEARPKWILEGEQNLLTFLARQGHPFAKLEKREVFVDQQNTQVTVRYNIDMGSYAYFGDVKICGNFNVSSRFFFKKLQWQHGAPYDPCAVQSTLSVLENSRLFQSISISHENELIDGQYLPMQIEVSEAPPRTFELGGSYSTQLGPGFTTEWKHRNYFHGGEHVGITLEALEKRQDINFFYIEPDVWTQDQDLIFRTELQHEKVEAYKERSISLSSLLNKRVTSNFRYSYGLKYTNLFNSSADADPLPGTDIIDCVIERSYNLFKIPLNMYWSNVCDLLDPQEGSSLSLKAIPSFQITNPYFDYHTFIGTYTTYHPLSKTARVIFASKTTLGSIIGTSRENIPPSERFYAGSENNLRGYDYFTVSSILTTLNADGSVSDKPIGGKSIFTQSLELRWHATEKIGLVGFYDFGNVFDSSYWTENIQIVAEQQEGEDFKRIIETNKEPTLLHSVGIGVRYYTPVGPLRFDIAIPLSRRKGIDSWGQIYFSVGQAF